MGNGRYPYKIAPGVWARSGQSIQVEFRYRGERCRETFPTAPPNVGGLARGTTQHIALETSPHPRV
jgi:hypothetical protein